MGDHDIQGISRRAPICTMWEKPMSLSNPLVRLWTIEPSFVETITISISPSFRLKVTTASRSPEGDGAMENAPMNGVRSGFGARSMP